MRYQTQNKKRKRVSRRRGRGLYSFSTKYKRVKKIDCKKTLEPYLPEWGAMGHILRKKEAKNYFVVSAKKLKFH